MMLQVVAVPPINNDQVDAIFSLRTELPRIPAISLGEAYIEV